LLAVTEGEEEVLGSRPGLLGKRLTHDCRQGGKSYPGLQAVCHLAGFLN